MPGSLGIASSNDFTALCHLSFILNYCLAHKVNMNNDRGHPVLGSSGSYWIHLRKWVLQIPDQGYREHRDMVAPDCNWYLSLPCSVPEVFNITVVKWWRKQHCWLQSSLLRCPVRPIFHISAAQLDSWESSASATHHALHLSPAWWNITPSLQLNG